MDSITELLQEYEQALDDARQTQEPKLIGNALSSLAKAYQGFGEMSRAIVFYEQALDIEHGVALGLPQLLHPTT